MPIACVPIQGVSPVLNTNAVQILTVNSGIRIGKVHVIHGVERLNDQLQAQILMQRKVLGERCGHFES